MVKTVDDTTDRANGAQRASVASLEANAAKQQAGVEVIPPPDKPRKRGRPKGTPKTGGRQRGTKNWNSEATREYFIENGKLLETLADLIAGRQMLTQPTSGPGRVEWRYPPIELRAKTAVGIYNKCWPDFQVVDQTNHDAIPPQADNRQISRAVILLLESGVETTDAPGDSPSGLRIPGATPHVPGRDGSAVQGSVAPNNGRGGLAERDHMEREGNLDIPKKISPKKNKIQITDGQDNAAPVAEPVGDFGHSIMLRERAGDGRERWMVHDAAGQHICSAWGHDEAVRLSTELIETGRVVR